MLRAVKAACPDVVTVYGGVYPTYHAGESWREEPAVDVIVRGEGEATAVELVEALAARRGRARSAASASPASPTAPAGRSSSPRTGRRSRTWIAYRVGWELIERLGPLPLLRPGPRGDRAVLARLPAPLHLLRPARLLGQLAPPRPGRLADEIEWLHRTHDVRFFTLADENPTTLQRRVAAFLEELAGRRLPVHFFATIRATDIVRDADMLPLYRQAGILYVLMGIESTDGEVLRQIHKGSTTAARLTRPAGC